MRQPLLLIPCLVCFSLAAGHAATVGQTDRFLPLVLDGGGWSTQVTVTNLSTKTGTVVAMFMTAQGVNEVWRLGLKSTAGRPAPNQVEATLAPGASMVIETAGTAATLTRGFADVIEWAELPIGVEAVLIQREGDRIVQTIRVAHSPAHEKRSVVPLDLMDPSEKPLLVWVTLTSGTLLELVFRNLAGEPVLNDRIEFDGRAQLFVNVREKWPQLKDFRGTMQWVVTFPGADRYEQRTLAGLTLLAPDDRAWTVTRGMTLPADQGVTSPY